MEEDDPRLGDQSGETGGGRDNHEQEPRTNGRTSSLKGQRRESQGLPKELWFRAWGPPARQAASWQSFQIRTRESWKRFKQK